MIIGGVVLAPTDAALGQAVCHQPPSWPTRIRRGPNVESGLNDGICVPLLFIAVAAADDHSELAGGRGAATLVFQEIGLRDPRRPGRPASLIAAIIRFARAGRRLIARRMAAGDPRRGGRARIRNRRPDWTDRASSQPSSPGRGSSAGCSGRDPAEVNRLVEGGEAS